MRTRAYEYALGHLEQILIFGSQLLPWTLALKNTSFDI